VKLGIKTDRVRYKTQVIDALVAAAEALATSSLTPPRTRFEVNGKIRMRRLTTRRFTCEGRALQAHLKGRLSKRDLWSRYVVEHKKQGSHLSFSDDETRGGGGSGRDEPDRTSEILSSNFRVLAPCLQAEAGRNRRFKGVTLQFRVSGSGRAQQLSFKERGVSARLKRCLKSALRKIKFQRHGGPPRRVDFPMYIQR
jgi:hypothetical protein